LPSIKYQYTPGKDVGGGFLKSSFNKGEVSIYCPTAIMEHWRKRKMNRRLISNSLISHVNYSFSTQIAI